MAGGLSTRLALVIGFSGLMARVRAGAEATTSPWLVFMLARFYGKQTVLAKKRRGPAPTGKGVQVVVRLQPAPLSELDKWAAKQSDRPTRAEAIRRLVETGLKAKLGK